MWKFKGKARPEFAVAPGDLQESVWDYPRPPVCVADSREIEVRIGEMVVAKTRRAVRVLETASPPTFYLPPEDVDFTFLEQTPGNSFCEWKGSAAYWSLFLETGKVQDVGWSYPMPTTRFEMIKGFLSFYPGKLDCRVDGQQVRPQEGGFYGGWVTDEIVGPWKGGPGSSGW